MLFAVCALAWFLFFPNAPYITTDVVHIHDDHVTASWFHLISIMSYAWTGLSLGYLSLYLMQEVVRARCGRVIEWCFVFVHARRRYGRDLHRPLSCAGTVGTCSVTRWII